MNLCKGNMGRIYLVLLKKRSSVPLQVFVITIYHCHACSWTAVLF